MFFYHLSGREGRESSSSTIDNQYSIDQAWVNQASID